MMYSNHKIRVRRINKNILTFLTIIHNIIWSCLHDIKSCIITMFKIKYTVLIILDRPQLLLGEVI